MEVFLLVCVERECVRILQVLFSVMSLIDSAGKEGEGAARHVG